MLSLAHVLLITDVDQKGGGGGGVRTLGALLFSAPGERCTPDKYLK